MLVGQRSSLSVERVWAFEAKFLQQRLKLLLTLIIGSLGVVVHPIHLTLCSDISSQCILRLRIYAPVQSRIGILSRRRDVISQLYVANCAMSNLFT